MKFISDESWLYSGFIKNVSHLLYGLLGWTKLEGIRNEHLLTCTCRREAAEVETRNMTIYQAMGGQATTCDWNLLFFSCIQHGKGQPAETKTRWGKDVSVFCKKHFRALRLSCSAPPHVSLWNQSKTLPFAQLSRKLRSRTRPYLSGRYPQELAASLER